MVLFTAGTGVALSPLKCGVIWTMPLPKTGSPLVLE